MCASSRFVAGGAKPDGAMGRLPRQPMGVLRPLAIASTTATGLSKLFAPNIGSGAAMVGPWR